MWHDLKLRPINLWSLPMAVAKNEHTGDSLISRGLSKEGEANFDLIFGKKKTNGGYVPPPLPLDEYPDNGPITTQEEPPSNEW